MTSAALITIIATEMSATVQPFQCAGLSIKGVKCPLVDCNDGSGRLLFQFIDEPSRGETRFREYLASLSKREQWLKWRDKHGLVRDYPIPLR